jgi:hypothetical protein
VTGTANLKKLEGRFTRRVELSDADVDAVIRQVILAKKPGAVQPIDQIMQTNLGEISRHLAGTSIAIARTTSPSSRTITRSCPSAAVSGRTPARPGPDRHRQPVAQPVEHDPQGDPNQSGRTRGPRHPGRLPVLRFGRQAAAGPRAAPQSPRADHEMDHRDDDQRLMARACGLVFLIDRVPLGCGSLE